MKTILGLLIAALVLGMGTTYVAAEPSTRPADAGAQKDDAAIGEVQGNVLNEDKSPGAKLLVRIFRGSDFDPKSAKRLYKKNLNRGDVQPVAEAISKPDGTFVLKSLEPGDYVVIVADRKASCAAEATVVVKDATPVSVTLQLKKVELKPNKEGGEKKPKD